VRSLKTFVCLLSLVTTVGSPTAFAQSPAAATPQWKNTVELYLMAPNLDGSVGLGATDTDVNLDAGAIFDVLDGAFLGSYIGEAGRWGMLADLAYMDLKQDGTGSLGVLNYELNVKQTLFGFVGLYRLTDTLQLTFGGRYVDLTNRLSLAGPQNEFKGEVSESWFDPTIGFRYVGAMGEKWVFNGSADIGGFGVGSDLTWFLGANVAYRLTGRTQFYAGFRYVDFDYEDGAGSDRFKFDVAQYGPLAGFRFKF